MPDPSPILRFSRATVEVAYQYDSRIADVSFSLGAGELMLARLDIAEHDLPLADAAQGLVDLAGGSVEFMGEDWATMSPRRSAEMRGRTGRTFGGQSWISNLNVEENVLLSQRHHTARAQAEIVAEAVALAMAFGLPRIPQRRPSDMRPHDLQRAACVRAFLGRPQLLIIENPLTAASPGLLPALIDAVNDARARGAGVVWTSTEPSVWSNPRLRPTLKCTLAGSRMIADSE